jgi:hypothetical protein
MTNIRIINSKFLEIEATRNPEFSGKLKLKTNVQINLLEKAKDSKEMLKTVYTFEIDYGELGKVKVKGELFLLSDAKTVKTVLKNKESKEYNTPEYIEITNLLIQRASIKAFELEEELGLPIHIKLPSLSVKSK